MGVPPIGGDYEGGRDRGYRDVYLQEEEHDGAVNIYYTHYGPMPVYGEEARIADTESAVVTGGTGISKEGVGDGGGVVEEDGDRDGGGVVGGSRGGNGEGDKERGGV